MPDQPHSEFDPDDFVQRTGLVYIPLYSPARPVHTRYAEVSNINSKNDTQLSTPLHGRMTKNSMSYSDPCLNLSYEDHDDSDGSSPHDSDIDSCALLVPHFSSIIGKFLSIPEHPSEIPTKNIKSCGRVLTSKENLKILEEKEMKKQLAKKLKEERKALREKKRLEKLRKTNRVEPYVPHDMKGEIVSQRIFF